MTTNPLPKIIAHSASLICEDAGLSDEAKRCVSDQFHPADYVFQLMSSKLWPDAIRFLSRALPKREATWWACLAARSTVNDATPTQQIQALEAAEAWVYRPNEENRRLAYERAVAATFENPSSWAAMAAFWSGGSMTAPDLPVVPPADNLTSKAATGAIMLSAVHGDPRKLEETYQLYLKQGLDIAAGGDGRAQPELDSE